MSCGLGRRHGSDPALLWLWPRPVAIAPIGPLVWEPPNDAGAALKRPKKKNFLPTLLIPGNIHPDVQAKSLDLILFSSLCLSFCQYLRNAFWLDL